MGFKKGMKLRAKFKTKEDAERFFREQSWPYPLKPPKPEIFSRTGGGDYAETEWIVAW